MADLNYTQLCSIAMELSSIYSVIDCIAESLSQLNADCGDRIANSYCLSIYDINYLQHFVSY